MMQTGAVTRKLIAEIYDGLAKRATSLDDVAKFEERAMQVRMNDQVKSSYIEQHFIDTKNANNMEFSKRAKIMKKQDEKRHVIDIDLTD